MRRLQIDSRRSAFTLIELLVVIAVIAILLALVLSATQQVRQAAARVKCGSNLRQIGIALNSYAGDKGHFPSAYTSPGNMAPGWSWAAHLLPYLEQDDLYDQAAVNSAVFGGGSNPATPDTLTQTSLPIFRCPSDTGASLNVVRENFATSNYRAVAGYIPMNVFIENMDLGGVMFENSRIGFEDITDGTSNTLLVGECTYDESIDKWGAIWPGMTGIVDGVVRISDVMWWVDDGTSVVNGTAPQAFSSKHRRGANFVFCDGSVRLVPNGGDVQVLKFLAGRNDDVDVDVNF
jgi:prepilin-type N-terminal cleavage/methylation domain-containing protein/prepilin-type processing-associated H-X9-DG protein